MKISIITPSFNQGNYIADAIESVLAQDYPDFEHIIIDGASQDNTIEVLKRYTHLKWISEKDQGQSDALNKGFRMATGEVICWLNCDDFYLPGAFNKAITEIKASDADGVYSDLQFCNEFKEPVSYYRSNRPSRFLSLFITYICSETLFIRRRIIDQNIKVRTDMHFCMDQEFVARILHSGFRLKYVKGCFATFRWQGMNKSILNKETQSKSLKEAITVFNRYNNNISLNVNNNIIQKIFSIMRSMVKVYRLYLKITS